MASLIEDYALIGDCRGAALVSKQGDIDWLCLPRFDAAACLAALLGHEHHGQWRITPTAPVQNVTRRYRDGTLILETDFTTASGQVRLTDFMPPQTQAADVLRIVECLRGEVSLTMRLTPRFDYGAVLPWIRRDERGIQCTAGPDTLYLRSNVRLEVHNHAAVAELVLSEHQQATFQLTWANTYEPPPIQVNALQAQQDAEAWWREWSQACQYRGPWRDEVVGSLVTLKALTYAPTGGIVAAATTSLPEQIGGARNWDYRYCWIRDATFTLYALLVGGYIEEARAWRRWLVNAVAGDPSQLQIMYGVCGERRLTELQLDWLPGYEGSRPVRIGNAAYRQYQLDVPGELMEALHLARKQGLDACDDAWRVQLATLDFVEQHWQEADEGIWEIRGPRRHFTHSKVMAWVAADRAVKDVEQFGLPGDVQRWRDLRDRIHREVSALGYNEKLGAFVQYYGAEEPDASLLMLPLVGFIDAQDQRMQGTISLIEQRLVHDGLVDRYCTRNNVDGLSSGEGAFLLCSFWLADNYALSGKIGAARELFQMLLGLRNDVGLLAEEYDPTTKRMLGNFPQAFSHVGLINTARNLTRAGGPAEDRAEA